METRTIVEVSIEADEQPVTRCGNCGSESVHPTEIRSAFWQDDRLVVVEDIPAMVCHACHEQFLDDSTIIILDLLRGDGFPSENARGELTVPVFSFRDRLRSEPS
jgi:YgiT-type zinc finger domain-containing protein